MLTLLLASAASPTAARTVELAIVIDDVGYSLARAERVLALPSPITLGVLPFTPEATAVARMAAATGKEVILHQPMEPLPTPSAQPMDGTLTLGMAPDRFNATVEAAMAAIPGIVGVNNHTGSRLTQNPEAMRRFMTHLARRQLFFLDSRTTADTVAYDVAREERVPALKRDVFLDHFRTPAAVAAEYERALNIARRQGFAVVIAHPHDVSLSLLEERLAELPPDVTLVGLSRLAREQNRRDAPAFSPLHQAVLARP
ncbi:MAG: divergent polysaccharide deacetylase family protein [Pseudomonadales bacterium]